MESLCKIHQNAKPKTPKRPNQNPRNAESKMWENAFPNTRKEGGKNPPRTKKKPMGTQSKKFQGRHAMLQSTSSRPTDCQSALSGFLRLGWHWIVVLNDILKKPIFTNHFFIKLQPRKVTKKGHFFRILKKKRPGRILAKRLGHQKLSNCDQNRGFDSEFGGESFPHTFKTTPPKKQNPQISSRWR